jgi:hypothetical protein
VASNPLAAPRLVPREESRRAAGASGRLRLVGVPPVRPAARRDDVRPATAQATEVTRELRTLCCEGSCSPGRAKFLETRHSLREAGYSDVTKVKRGDSLRASESAALSHTSHYFLRTWSFARTVYQTWACTVCGTERTYGAEEEL